MDCLLKVALPGCYDSEGDACFGEAHGCAFGAVEVGAGLDDLGGEGLGEAVFGEMPVAVHRVEVELRRVDDEVVVQVVGVRHGLQRACVPCRARPRLPAVPDPCPRLGFLRGELDGHAVMRSGFDAGPRRRDDAVIIAACQVDPGLDLVRPCLDLGVIRLGPERQRALAGGLRGLAVARVVLDARDQQGDPACKGEDLAVLIQREALALEGDNPAEP